MKLKETTPFHQELNRMPGRSPISILFVYS